MPRPFCSAYELLRFGRYFSPVHTALSLYKNKDQDVRACGFASLTEMEEKISVSVLLILSQCCGREKYLFLCAQTDLLRKTSVFVNIHFEGHLKASVFVRFFQSSVSGFTKTDSYICVFVQKRSSVNGA